MSKVRSILLLIAGIGIGAVVSSQATERVQLVQPVFKAQSIADGDTDRKLMILGGRITSYQLYVAYNQDELIAQVNDAISSGLQPVGGVAFHDGFFVQAMGK